MYGHKAVLSLWLLTLLSTPALADEVVRIFGNDYAEPKIYQHRGEPVGVLVDVLRAVEKRMPDYQFDIQVFPWARSYRKAEVAEGAIVGISKTAERLALFDYSEPVFFDEVVLVVRKGEEFDYREPTDLKGRIVGLGRGGSFGDDFEALRAAGDILVDEDSGPTMRLDKLLAGRIDVAFFNPGKLSVELAFNDDPLLARRRNDVTILPLPFKIDPNYLAFAKPLNRGAFLQAFNAVIRSMQDSGELTSVVEDAVKQVKLRTGPGVPVVNN